MINELISRLRNHLSGLRDQKRGGNSRVPEGEPLRGRCLWMQTIDCEKRGSRGQSELEIGFFHKESYEPITHFAVSAGL